jgi:hypothetical protein
MNTRLTAVPNTCFTILYIDPVIATIQNTSTIETNNWIMYGEQEILNGEWIDLEFTMRAIRHTSN